MRLQDKTSQPLLNAWSRVVSENWNEHLKNCIVGTWKAFLHCEEGGAFSDFLLR